MKQNSMRIGLCVLFGIFLVGSIVGAGIAKRSMDANAEYEQYWGIIIEGIINPESPSGIEITEGHAVYQQALMIFQVALSGAIIFGTAFGFSLQPLLTLRTNPQKSQKEEG